MAEWGQDNWGGGDAWSTGGGAAGGGDKSASNFQDNVGNAPDNNHVGHHDGNDIANGENDKCFGCGETGHRRAECPTAEQMTCHACKQPGHMSRDCPDKEMLPCRNCGEPGHHQSDCTGPRKINRDHVADVAPEVAWEKIKQAVRERDADDAKEAVQEYVKALDGVTTYRQLQQGLIDSKINLWLIAVERPILPTFTNMDLQGNMEKKYSVSYRFSEKPERPREVEGWPQSYDEILARLDDAGEVTNNGKSICHNCKGVGHISKNCPEEKMENLDAPRVHCSNCDEDGHRVRDCPIPRVDKFACKNCGGSGHKVAECPEPPNPDNMECRKCHEMGHMAKDCPQSGGGRACHNCGQEGHISKDCDQPRNTANMVCTNCDETGHSWKECPKPKDWSKVQCSQCKEYGHTKVRCKALPVDDFEAGDYHQQDHEVPAGGDQPVADPWGSSTQQQSDSPW